MKINCIIVDDEPASREILERYVSDCESLLLVKSCHNAFEATDVINSTSVQLIFLDINMPKLSGMKFYRSLVSPPKVIFTTAYPEYAVEGFEVDAIDYLLKPFPFERFLKAVNKAIDKIRENGGSSGLEKDYILLRADKKIHRIIVDEIFLLEAIGDYVKVHFGDKHIIVHETFQNLIAQFPGEKIVRVHKSYAVSLNNIESIEGNQINIGNIKIPIGQTYKSGFMNKFNSQQSGT